MKIRNKSQKTQYRNSVGHTSGNSVRNKRVKQRKSAATTTVPTNAEKHRCRAETTYSQCLVLYISSFCKRTPLEACCVSTFDPRNKSINIQNGTYNFHQSLDLIGSDNCNHFKCIDILCVRIEEICEKRLGKIATRKMFGLCEMIVVARRMK